MFKASLRNFTGGYATSDTPENQSNLNVCNGTTDLAPSIAMSPVN